MARDSARRSIWVMSLSAGWIPFRRVRGSNISYIRPEATLDVPAESHAAVCRDTLPGRGRSGRPKQPDALARIPDRQVKESSPVHDGIQPMEAQSLLLPVCTGGYPIGLLPYRTAVVGFGQAGHGSSLFRASRLSSRHLQPPSFLAVLPLAEQTPTPKNRGAGG